MSKEKGSVKSASRCCPDYSTAKQLGVRFESVTNHQKDIKSHHHPHILICSSLHIPVPCYSSAEGLGRKCGMASCFVRKPGHLHAPNGGGRHASKMALLPTRSFQNSSKMLLQLFGTVCTSGEGGVNILPV